MSGLHRVQVTALRAAQARRRGEVCVWYEHEWALTKEAPSGMCEWVCGRCGEGATSFEFQGQVSA